MRRILLIASGAVAAALVLGFLSLGAFPPRPAQHPVHAAIPADRLAASG